MEAWVDEDKVLFAFSQAVLNRLDNEKNFVSGVFESLILEDFCLCTCLNPFEKARKVKTGMTPLKNLKLFHRSLIFFNLHVLPTTTLLSKLWFSYQNAINRSSNFYRNEPLYI